MGSIHILTPETYRLIAAGEVIDRPGSALRELIDNSIDAGASEIRVSLEGGGVDLLRVSDDGSGMSREDLELSILDHATSKILTADDLLSARTMGFRGEALASIAAVARIEISTRDAVSESGWILRSEPGGAPSVEPAAARRGTTVTVRGLFERFPARRQFLKRPASEASLCRQVFVERAAAHPAIAFVWESGAEREHFPKSWREERIALLYPEIPPKLLSRFETEALGAKFEAVYADPAFHRKDRKYLQIFVNRRKVPEWGFTSLIEYLFSEYLPGGMKPCAFLFAEIDPSQADFNIHPAKREVRLKNPEPLKSAFYSSFRTLLRAELGSGPTDLSQSGAASRTRIPGFFEPGGPEGERSGVRAEDFGTTAELGGNLAGRAFWDKVSAASAGSGPAPAADWARESAASPRPADSARGGLPFRYLGRGFGPFLVFEMDETLYILDQHAAHERILYDELSAKKPASQALLVPFIFECDGPGSARALADALPELSGMGYQIEPAGDDFAVNGVPAFMGEKGIQALVDCFSEGSAAGDAGKDIVATMACRAAVKDGDALDDAAAVDLIGRSLALDFPRCPHGRPIWVKLDKAALYRMVGRITS